MPNNVTDAFKSETIIVEDQPGTATAFPEAAKYVIRVKSIKQIIPNKMPSINNSRKGKTEEVTAPSRARAVTARKDDAAAADQAATAKVAVSVSAAWDGGLIQTTPG